jgi:hypothetical protein
MANLEGIKAMLHQANQISCLVPPAVTSGEPVERPRQWADGRCLKPTNLACIAATPPTTGRAAAR